MKVTAIIPDDLVADVKAFAKGKNLTESLIAALNDWRYYKRLEHLSTMLSDEPVEFSEGFSAEAVRKLNNRNDRS